MSYRKIIVLNSIYSSLMAFGAYDDDSWIDWSMSKWHSKHKKNLLDALEMIFLKESWNCTTHWHSSFRVSANSI